MKWGVVWAVQVVWLAWSPGSGSWCGPKSAARGRHRPLPARRHIPLPDGAVGREL